MDKVFRKIGGFTFTTFKEISVYMNGETDEPWFLGSDIARALGMKQRFDRFYARIPNYLKRRGLVEIPVFNQYGPTGKTQISDSFLLNEYGMCYAIFTSNKPLAKNFIKWVFIVVLPAIKKMRRTGESLNLNVDEKTLPL